VCLPAGTVYSALWKGLPVRGMWAAEASVKACAAARLLKAWLRLRSRLPDTRRLHSRTSLPLQVAVKTMTLTADAVTQGRHAALMEAALSKWVTSLHWREARQLVETAAS
jgi:hypothetical protein